VSDRRIDSTDRLAATLDMLARLVAFDTESVKSNLPLIADVESYLQAHGVDYVKVPNAAGDKAALFATIGPSIDGGIILSGHTDCVPVAGQTWTSDPFTLRRDGSRVYARGACDMKGFDALCLAMVPEFQRADLKRPIHILLSYDEEIGCRGPLDTIARFGADLPRPGIAIVGEPSLMEVADAHKSITTYRTVVRGHEAHSSKAYLGTSAIEVAHALMSELYRLADELKAEGDPTGRFDPPFSSIHVGMIHGGTARNILAKECTFDWEFRGLPNVAYDTAIDRMNAQIERIVAAKAPDPTKRAHVETHAHHPVPGLNPEPGSAAESLALKLGRRNATITVSYASEAGQFQQAGIATVICGPGSIDQAHQPDEYIEIAQLAAGVEFMRRLVTELS